MKFSLKPLLSVVVGSLIIATITSCQNFGLANKTSTGMDKTEVVNILGEPDEVEEIVKNIEYIFGSVEGLWDQIEMGGTLVILRYETWDGYKELYFINDSSKVAGEFYWYKDSRKNPVF